ncbi:MAG: hypothetical protein JST22_16835 [Bacteroidetes bacterium]|nr:hypothetical protein [Bacteroidota bacterium]
MRSPAKFLLALFTAGTALLLCRPEACAQVRTGAASVSIVTSGDRGLTFDVRNLGVHAVGSDSTLVLLPNAPRFLSTGRSPKLPPLVFAAGIPFDATDLQVSIQPIVIDTVRLAHPAVIPGDPLPVVSLRGASVQRGLRTTAVIYQPARIEGRTAYVIRDARITLSWRGGASAKNGRPRSESPAMEEVARQTILNYDRARAWRTRPNAPGLLRASAWGMDRGVVMLAGHDGLYSASVADLTAAGAQGLSGTSVSGLRVTNRRTPVRFYVDDRNGNGLFDADDRLEFYAHRNPGEEQGFYYSDVTDTNAYLVTWNGGAGAGLLLESRSGTGSAPELQGYDSTLHIEQENVYFPGLTLSDFQGGDIATIHVSERVKNERFYWGRVDYPQQKILTFNCSPAYAPNSTVRFSVRMAGVSDTVHQPDFQLNGIDLGSRQVDHFSDTTFVFDIPTSYLLNGRNTLVIVPTVPDGNDQPTWGSVRADVIYYDYIELQGRWLPSTFNDDDPKVRIPFDASGPVRVALNGLHAPATHAASATGRTLVDSSQRGWLFRMTSRQFDQIALRQFPGFAAQLGDSMLLSPRDLGGIMLIEAGGSTGRALRSAFYNLYGVTQAARDQALADARSFLESVGDGNIVLAGFSVGGGEQGELPQELKDAFGALGAKSVLGNNFVSSWTFAARKGAPSTAVERYASLGDNNRGVSMDAFIPDPGGDAYRSVVTLSGVAGEEFQMGALHAPPLRNHAGDSLVSSANRADMLVITHPGFRPEAERLATHRAANPPVPGQFTVRVVDVNTIYDEFNDGVKSPLAIRRFLQYADSAWTSPTPGYVLLFGDASWDPQQRLPGSTMRDFVPTMGIPSTDYLYTVAFGDTLDQIWQQVIGRLPVTSDADARAVVDKIVEYDSLPPAYWNKRFVYLAGGSSTSEVESHRLENENLADGYVLAPPFLGDTAMIYRTSDNLALPDAKDAPWAQREINKGALWVNFVGHGAIDVADLDYGFPEQFDNGNKYFVLATFSCQTGAFAEPTSPVRNERFVTYPGRGAIAAIGGTSFSFSDFDTPFQQQLHSRICDEASFITPPDTAFGALHRERSLGLIFANAKYEGYFRGFGAGWELSLVGVRARNNLLMYNLLADPAMKLAVRDDAEFAFADVSAANTRGVDPIPGDSSVFVRARVWNYGVPVIPAGDSVMLVGTITDHTRQSLRDTLFVKDLQRYADVVFTLPLGKDPGEYTIRLQIDPAQSIPEHYRPDDDTSFTIRVRGNQVLPIEPVPYGRVAGYDNVAIHLLNPPSGGGAVIELDTVPTFASPDRITSLTTGTVSVTELTTTWTFSIPAKLRAARRFWWRAIATSGDTATARLFPLEETFTVEPSAAAEYLIGGAGQMNRGVITNLVNDSSGVGPGSRPVLITMKVLGQSAYDTTLPADPGQQNFVDRNFATIFVDGKDYNRPAYDGINVLVLRDALPVGDRLAFALYRQDGAENFIHFTDTLSAGLRVLLWTNGASFDFTFNGDSTRAALRALGVSDTVAAGVGREDSYALMGGKGLVPREAWVRAAPLRGQGVRPPYYASLATSLVAPSGAGSIVLPVAGPATAWRSVRFDRTAASLLAVTVFGVRRDGTVDSLFSVADANTVDLRSVDVRLHPRIELRAAFPGDSTLRLRSVALDYDPSPELAIVPSTLHMQADSVMQGDVAQLNGTIVNLSRTRAATQVISRLVLQEDTRRTVVDTLVIPTLAPLDSVRHAFTIATDRLTGDRAFLLQANPDDLPAEPYRQNNELRAALRIGLDVNKPTIAIYADNSRLMPGDFTAPRPEFEIRVNDNSRLKLNDSSAVRIILDNDVVTLATGAMWRPATGEGNYRGSFIYTPPQPLDTGRHDIRVFTSDATGNADTTDFIPFYVERELAVRDVVNWPNPFVNKTTFTFMVAGASVPKSGEIAIYTVTGRKVKTIRLGGTELNIGFNRVEWDGLDDDHDRLANGVYLYKVMVDDGEQRQEVIEKLVVMR